MRKPVERCGTGICSTFATRIADVAELTRPQNDGPQTHTCARHGAPGLQSGLLLRVTVVTLEGGIFFFRV